MPQTLFTPFTLSAKKDVITSRITPGLRQSRLSWGGLYIITILLNDFRDFEKLFLEPFIILLPELFVVDRIYYNVNCNKLVHHFSVHIGSVRNLTLLHASFNAENKAIIGYVLVSTLRHRVSLNRGSLNHRRLNGHNFFFPELHLFRVEEICYHHNQNWNQPVTFLKHLCPPLNKSHNP